MTRRIIVEPGAKLDINASRDWYAAIHPDLGEEFVDAVITALDRLQRSTDGSLPVPNDKRVRRILMKRFPFQIVFYANGKTVHVVALRHTSRAPAKFTPRRR